MILPSIIDAMENSPLVDLTRLCEALELDGRILAKLDYLLPGASKKDRAARRVIEDARASGDLQPGQCVVELTSGNMGTGLAIVCGVLGHPFIAVMSEGNSPERARMMQALGAEVVLVPQAPRSKAGEVSGADLDLVESAAHQLTKERGAFRANQFQNESNPRAHETGTAPEIWHQSKGEVTAFCDFVGTGGTVGGATQFFVPKGVRCYAVEPEGAEVLGKGDISRPNHPIQGGGYMKGDLDHLEKSNLAGIVSVSSKQVTGHARMLATAEGVFGGFSAGANCAAAAHLLRTSEVGGTVAIVICDSGLKYLSTDLWERS